MKSGVWWVNLYSNGRGCNLTHCAAQANGFHNQITGTKTSSLGDGNAKDKHFERLAFGSPVEGEDFQYISLCDIVYFSGHGNENGPIFGVDQDSGQALTSECRWGGALLKWIVLDACRTLSEANVKGRWEKVFDGLRYILGFGSDSADEPHRGTKLADELNSGQWAIREAWQRVCETTCGQTYDRWAWLRATGSTTTETVDDRWNAASLPQLPNPITGTDYLTSSC